MRISRITVWQKTLPLVEPCRLSGGGLTFESLGSTFVRIDIDETLAGYCAGKTTFGTDGSPQRQPQRWSSSRTKPATSACRMPAIAAVLFKPGTPQPRSVRVR